MVDTVTGTTEEPVYDVTEGDEASGYVPPTSEEGILDGGGAVYGLPPDAVITSQETVTDEETGQQVDIVTYTVPGEPGTVYEVVIDTQPGSPTEGMAIMTVATTDGQGMVVYNQYGRVVASYTQAEVDEMLLEVEDSTNDGGGRLLSDDEVQSQVDWLIGDKSSYMMNFSTGSFGDVAYSNYFNTVTGQWETEVRYQDPETGEWTSETLVKGTEEHDKFLEAKQLYEDAAVTDEEAGLIGTQAAITGGGVLLVAAYVGLALTGPVGWALGAFASVTGFIYTNHRSKADQQRDDADELLADALGHPVEDYSVPLPDYIEGSYFYDEGEEIPVEPEALSTEEEEALRAIEIADNAIDTAEASGEAAAAAEDTYLAAEETYQYWAAQDQTDPDVAAKTEQAKNERDAALADATEAREWAIRDLEQVALAVEDANEKALASGDPDTIAAAELLTAEYFSLVALQQAEQSVHYAELAAQEAERLAETDPSVENQTAAEEARTYADDAAANLEVLEINHLSFKAQAAQALADLDQAEADRAAAEAEYKGYVLEQEKAEYDAALAEFEEAKAAWRAGGGGEGPLLDAMNGAWQNVENAQEDVNKAEVAFARAVSSAEAANAEALSSKADAVDADQEFHTALTMAPYDIEQAFLYTPIESSKGEVGTGESAYGIPVGAEITGQQLLTAEESAALGIEQGMSYTYVDPNDPSKTVTVIIDVGVGSETRGLVVTAVVVEEGVGTSLYGYDGSLWVFATEEEIAAAEEDGVTGDTGTNRNLATDERFDALDALLPIQGEEIQRGATDELAWIEYQQDGKTYYVFHYTDTSGNIHVQTVEKGTANGNRFEAARTQFEAGEGWAGVSALISAGLGLLGTHGFYLNGVIGVVDEGKAGEYTDSQLLTLINSSVGMYMLAFGVAANQGYNAIQRYGSRQNGHTIFGNMFPGTVIPQPPGPAPVADPPVLDVSNYSAGGIEVADAVSEADEAMVVADQATAAAEQAQSEWDAAEDAAVAAEERALVTGNAADLRRAEDLRKEADEKKEELQEKQDLATAAVETARAKYDIAMRMTHVTDEDGNLVLGADGKPIPYTVDADGNVVLDKNGNPYPYVSDSWFGGTEGLSSALYGSLAAMGTQLDNMEALGAARLDVLEAAAKLQEAYQALLADPDDQALQAAYDAAKQNYNDKDNIFRAQYNTYAAQYTVLWEASHAVWDLRVGTEADAKAEDAETKASTRLTRYEEEV